MKKVTRNSGITLVALVITIIILLILAGITISQLAGSGLFENARLAEDKYKNAENIENERLENYEEVMNKYLTGTSDSNVSEGDNNEINTPNLIHYWDLTRGLDDKIGTETLYSTISDLTFDSTNGVLLSGNDAYLETSDAYTLPESFTIVMEVKPTELKGNFPYLIGNLENRSCWGVALNNSLTQCISMFGNSYSDTVNIVDSEGNNTGLSTTEFNTIILTYDNDEIKGEVYINGVLQWFASAANTNYDVTKSLKFGGSTYYGETNGYYKSIKIYNKSLSMLENGEA